MTAQCTVPASLLIRQTAMVTHILREQRSQARPAERLLPASIPTIATMPTLGPRLRYQDTTTTTWIRVNLMETDHGYYCPIGQRQISWSEFLTVKKGASVTCLTLYGISAE